MKSKGQRVYEHKSPPYIPMIHVERRYFTTAADVVMVKNENHVPWEFLTAASRASWEQFAIGHHIFSGEPS